LIPRERSNGKRPGPAGAFSFSGRSPALCELSFNNAHAIEIARRAIRSDTRDMVELDSRVEIGHQKDVGRALG